MKPITQKHFFDLHNNNKPPLQWRRLSDFLTTFGYVFCSYLLAAPYHTASYFQAVRMTLWRILIAPVVRVVRATLAWIKPLASSATINNRIYVGIVLATMVAPLSACIHMIDGMKEVISVDRFYQCYYDLFLVLGPYFFSLCIVVAAMLWIPPKTKRIKFSHKSISFQLTRLLSVPLGIIIGKIVWLTLCDSNEDFERIGHPVFFIGGVVIAYIVMRILEYLVWRQEHAMNALIDSLEGLYKVPGLDHEKRNELAAPYWKELREFHSKY